MTERLERAVLCCLGLLGTICLVGCISRLGDGELFKAATLHCDGQRSLGDIAMDSLWRGLKGAMVGMAIAAILIGECLALAALAGFLVSGVAKFVSRLPRKHLRTFKNVAIALGFAALAGPIVVLGLRNRGIEIPDLSCLTSIALGLLGGGIVLLHEAGAKAQSRTFDPMMCSHECLHKEPNSRCRRPGMISAIKGSIWLAAGVLFWDVGNEGFWGFSLLICPPWFLISVVKNIIQRPGWGIAAIRVSMPLLTFAIAFGNGNLQWKVSDANAERVIKACEEFRVANGRYPSKLGELVPKYFASVPPAKHCMMGVFFYVNSDDHPMLWWTRYGFYRRVYSFDEKRWSNLD